MKRTIIVLIGILIFFSLIDDTTFNNNVRNYIERDYYKTNSYDYLISSNLNYFKTNKYYKNDITDYVDITNNYYPKNKQELLNVYYTILNNGWKDFSFYCDSSYTDCLSDIEELANDNKEFTNINQLVSPFNSFKSIVSSYDNGRIDVSVEKKYSDEEIDKINKEIDKIIVGLDINNQRTLKDKIRLFHDYLANINKYDTVRANTNESKYNSDSAIGALFEGYAICTGYTDAMSIFLDKLNVENYKIASEKHIWNAVNIDNEWLNIDLTWDDPVTSTGEDMITYDYFLVTTYDMLLKNDGEHNYDLNVYSFLE